MDGLTRRSIQHEPAAQRCWTWATSRSRRCRSRSAASPPSPSFTCRATSSPSCRRRSGTSPFSPRSTCAATRSSEYCVGRPRWRPVLGLGPSTEESAESGSPDVAQVSPHLQVLLDASTEYRTSGLLVCGRATGCTSWDPKRFSASTSTAYCVPSRPLRPATRSSRPAGTTAASSRRPQPGHHRIRLRYRRPPHDPVEAGLDRVHRRQLVPQRLESRR